MRAPGRKILVACALPECKQRVGARQVGQLGRPRRFCDAYCRWRYWYVQWRRLGHELGMVDARWPCPSWANCAVCRRRLR